MQTRVSLRKVIQDDAGMRLDNYLLKYYRGVPRARIYRAIRSGEVRVDGRRKQAAYHVCEHQSVRVPPLQVREDSTIQPTQKKQIQAGLAVLFEDEWILVINKPDGISVHAGTGQTYGLLDAIEPVEKKYYLVHRLDKDVSGCLLIAKSRKVLKELQQQWHTKACSKRYQALVFCEQRLKPKLITAPLPMKEKQQQYQQAQTYIEPIASSNGLAMINVEIATGRYHQIRRHLSGCNLAVIGDKRYGLFAKNRQFLSQHKTGGLFLHAQALTFLHPHGHIQQVKADWPEEKQKIISALLSMQLAQDK